MQTATHVCLITDFCPGGELFLVLERQPKKHFREDSARSCYCVLHLHLFLSGLWLRCVMA